MNTASTMAEENEHCAESIRSETETPHVTGRNIVFNAASDFRLNADMEVTRINLSDLIEDDLMPDEKPMNQNQQNAI